MQAPGTRAKRSLIVFTWDGGSLDHVTFDAEPQFDILFFDFTGRATSPDPRRAFLSQKTECKGDVLRVISRHVRPAARTIDYIALFDHDIRVRISDINRLLRIARAEALDSFAPALTHDSHYSYPRFLQKAGGGIRWTPWVEVMMPFYRIELFLAASDFYEDSITAYGIDSFVMPMFQHALGMDRIAIIDDITVTHTLPVSDGKRRCSNGRTPFEERIIARRRCIAWLQANRPDLVGTRWFYDSFAPLDGPARFWLLRLSWPFHQILRGRDELFSARRRSRHSSTKPI